MVEKSFKVHPIKIGSKEARLRWGRNQLGIKEDNILPSREIEVGNEILPKVDLTLPVLFAGKIFIENRGATEHTGSPVFVEYYKSRIAGSEWVQNRTKNNAPPNIRVNPATFSEPRQKVFSVQIGNNKVLIFKIEMHTEGDYDLERGRDASSARLFGSTEMQTMSTEKAIELLSKGYDIWSQIARIPNIDWVLYKPYDNYGRNIETGRFSDEASEIISFNGQSSLWEDRKWLDNDALVATIADIYRLIETGKRVVVPKTVDMELQETTLVGQALAQMLAVKKGTLLKFVTERHILGYYDRPAYDLIFTEEKRPGYLQDNLLVDPLAAKITDRNSKIVSAMRTAFTRPISSALEVWENTPLS